MSLKLRSPREVTKPVEAYKCGGHNGVSWDRDWG